MTHPIIQLIANRTAAEAEDFSVVDNRVGRNASPVINPPTAPAIVMTRAEIGHGLSIVPIQPLSAQGMAQPMGISSTIHNDRRRVGVAALRSAVTEEGGSGVGEEGVRLEPHEVQKRVPRGFCFPQVWQNTPSDSVATSGADGAATSGVVGVPGDDLVAGENVSSAVWGFTSPGLVG